MHLRGAEVRMRHRRRWIVGIAIALAAGCGGTSPAPPQAPAAGGGADHPSGGATPSPDLGGPAPPSSPPPPSSGALTDEQKLRAMRLISVFENDTIVLAYDYVEALGDGRGYTCGLGFTTGTGDALQVVDAYTKAVPQNPLATFLPRLQQLAAAGSGDTTGLTGFPAAWKQAAADAKFQQVQVAQTDVECYQPALAHAKALGLKTALAIAEVYDTVWMHGDGSDPDGAPALIAKASAQVSAASDEAGWLKAFLAVRRADLLNPADRTTQAAWSMAVGRVDEFTDLLAAKNFDLAGPIAVGHGYGVTVP
ncbi:MAG TPA: chitosanase [Polyangia bacterium]